MHPNPVFRNDDQARGLLTARARGFGVLTVNGPGAPLAAHVPFAAETTEIGTHLVRSNPIARALRDGPLPALMIVSGPDAYISPDWYGVDDQVPTWNYVAVHVHGMLELRPPEELRAHLDRLSAANEARLAPKPPWTMDKLSAEVEAKLMRQIVPARLIVQTVDSTWKLNQNKAPEARQRAAKALQSAAGAGHETEAMADLMASWAESH